MEIIRDSLALVIASKGRVPRLRLIDSLIFRSDTKEKVPEEEVLEAANLISSEFPQLRSMPTKIQVYREIVDMRNRIRLVDFAIAILKKQSPLVPKIQRPRQPYRSEANQIINARKYYSGLQTINRATLRSFS